MILKRVFFSFVLLFLNVQLFAQLPAGVNIDQLTDQQLLQFAQSNNLTGMSESELEAKARERGLTTDQIEKLKVRMGGLKNAPASTKTTVDISEQRKLVSPSSPKTSPDMINGLVLFGSEIFTKENLTFEPNVNIATPNNYVLGAGDQINVDIFGYSDRTQKYTISPDGSIRIPNIGPVKLAGLNMSEARNKLVNELSKVYPGLKAGNTNLQLTLGQLRSIRVNLIGEITRPGTYTISSLSTIANALYMAGGPSKIGSYRNVELVRAGKVVAHFDLYRYLFKGDLTENKLLQDDDVIKVSPYLARVEIRGAIKRSAIFELKEDEKLSTLLEYAGGLTDNAKRGILKVLRFGLKEQEVLVVEGDQISNFSLQTGDRVYINTISDRFNNRVIITGAVKASGNYSINNTPNLKSLLEKSTLEEDAYLERAFIRRLGNDLQPELVSIDLRDVISGKKNFELKREDSIHIYKTKELLPIYTVDIQGEVNKPSSYPFAMNMRIQDVILLAGGFTDGATKKLVEVSRRIRDSLSEGSYSYAKVYNVDLDKVSSESLLDYVLEPFDIIQVRKSPSYRAQGTVTLEGEVNYTGNFTIQGAQERISDVIKRAGGLKPGAYPEGALLLRKAFERDVDKNAVVLQSKINTIKSSFTDSLKAEQADKLLVAEKKRVNLDLKKAIDNPGSIYDFYLIDGDVLSVPPPLQTVQTFSGVYFPKKILYRPHLSFKRVIKESGGALPTGQLGRSYVLYPNGKIKSTHRYVLFRTYPRLKPGAEIYVPEKKKGNGVSATEIVGFSGVLTSIVSMIYLITR